MSDNTHLILSRRKNESLQIEVPDLNGTITTIFIDIEDVHRNQVKIGIEAPKAVSILRYELAGEARG